MNSASVFAPAKLNLFLAVTGRRPDGFHELESLVTPIEFGDDLTAIRAPGEDFSLACAAPGVPLDESNLVLRAARAFRTASGWTEGVRFVLEKRIPMGAGLGGGSSDAVAALRALNRLAGEPLGEPALERLAAQLGSDCPLFLRAGPAVMRGRGELISPVAPGPAARLRGRRILLFKPGFGISTAEAYAALARGGGRGKEGGGRNLHYLESAAAEARLTGWLADPGAPVENLLFNCFEPVAFAKHLALPTLLEKLRLDFGLAPLMTGSGSACFAMLDHKPAPEAGAIAAAIREAWGPSAWVMETAIP